MLENHIVYIPVTAFFRCCGRNFTRFKWSHKTWTYVHVNCNTI